MHAGMDFIASAIQKPGVNKHYSAFGGADALFKINRGASLLVHNAHFNCMTLKVQSVFDSIEQLVGEGHFFRTMHFRFNNIAAAGCGVAQNPGAREIMQ